MWIYNASIKYSSWNGCKIAWLVVAAAGWGNGNNDHVLRTERDFFLCLNRDGSISSLA